MGKPKKSKKDSFLNYFWEPYSKNNLTIYRALHFTKLYSLILIGIEFFFIVLFLIIGLFAEHALDNIKPIYIYSTLIIFIVVDVIYLYIRFYKITKLSHKTDANVAHVLGNDVTQSFDFGQIGLAVVDDGNHVVWINSYLQSRQFKIVDRNLIDCFEELADLQDGESTEIKVNNVYYDVKYIRNSHLYIFKDVTAYNEEHQNALNEAIVIGTLVFDTYDEIEKTTETRKFQSILHSINTIIDKYFSQHNTIVLTSSAEDTLYLLCNFENFDKMRDDKFSLLEEIHKSTHNEMIPLTISIGFAHGFNESIPSLFDKANKACSTALKRGGDQIIVSDGELQQTYGGSKKIMRQQNLVRYRTYAQQLSYFIRESSKVIISGHKISDMDSLGSSVGIYQFVKTVRRNDGSNIPAFVVYEQSSSQSNALSVYSQLKKHSMKGAFITPNEAGDVIDDKTLLIFVDVHNPMTSLVSKCFDITETSKAPTKVIVFDHHMKTTTDMEIDPLLECIDPSISATSEMVTNLLEYTEETIKIPQMPLDTMLAGIMLDTSFFKNHVDDSTFFACNLLMQRGANHNNAASMLKEAYETYQLKCMITSNVGKPENYDNFYLRNGLHIFLVCAEDPKNPDVILDKDILAKVADEHIATKDVDACFVIGFTGERTIYASARGNGKFNVQRVCESIEEGNGGGEFDRAAIQFDFKNKEEEPLTLLEVRDLIKEKIFEVAETSELNSNN